MVACFQFADGSIGNLTYCTVGSKTSGGERVEAYMQGMGLEADNFKRYSANGTTRQAKKFMFAAKGYDKQIADLVRDLRAGNAPQVTVRDGARSTIGCIRMLESAKDLTPKSIDWERAGN
jgi:hypothetical protein